MRDGKIICTGLALFLTIITMATVYAGYPFNRPSSAEQQTLRKRVRVLSSSSTQKGKATVNTPQVLVIGGQESSTSTPQSPRCSGSSGANPNPPPGTSPGAPPQDGSPVNPPAGSDPAATIIFAGHRNDKTVPIGHTNFSATSIRSIYICALWKNVQGSHDQVIKIYCPDGQLYQTLYVPFSTQSLPSMTKRVAWSPHPVPVLLVSQISGVYPVWAELPVAGSWAMRLRGTWTVKVYLDDSSASCGQASFSLNQ